MRKFRKEVNLFRWKYLRKPIQNEKILKKINKMISFGYGVL